MKMPKISYRPTPFFTVAITLIIAIVVLAMWLLFMIEASSVKQAQARAITSHRVTWQPPDISHCLNDKINTWDCIRHKENDDGTEDRT